VHLARAEATAVVAHKAKAIGDPNTGGRPTKAEVAARETHDNSENVMDYGNSIAYRTAKLAKSHPEIVERMKAGRLPEKSQKLRLPADTTERGRWWPDKGDRVPISADRRPIAGVASA
jgi:hypothetical protein